jgi:hypothetical protein
MHKKTQRGMITAEYAVGIIGACGLAGACLLPVLTSPSVRDVIATLFRQVLQPWW